MRLMFSDASIVEFFISVIAAGVFLFFMWLLLHGLRQKTIEVKQEDVTNDAYRFDVAFTALKQAIDHIQTPILLVAHEYASASISVRNQLKKNFPLVANSIAYEKNIYMQDHFNDVILDLLRHPVFFQTIEDYAVSPVSEIEIHLDLPKPYHFKLMLNTYEPTHILHNVLVVTLIDQSQSELLNQMRSDFIAHASHELRTPLTSLDGFIQTLLGVGVDDPQIQKQFLEIMQQQVGRMIRLTNGLLSLSRVERDEYRLLTEQVNLKQILQQILQEAQLKIKQAGIILEYQDDVEAQDVEIFADRDQLFQIFHNLLENAIRYASLGNAKEAKILCRLSFSEDSLKWPGLGWVVSIIDNGPGIEKNHIPRLTERFYRADDKNGGTGLGLAIVKHLVTRHKGALFIESQLGEGSCFSIWFPMHYT